MTTKTRNYINPEKLEELFGKRMSNKHVAQIYLEEMPPIVQALRQLRDGEPGIPAIQHRAHSLKGSFSLLCAEELVECAVRLEKAAEYEDRRTIKRSLNVLLVMVDELTEELKQMAS